MTPLAVILEAWIEVEGAPFWYPLGATQRGQPCASLSDDHGVYVFGWLPGEPAEPGVWRLAAAAAAITTPAVRIVDLAADAGGAPERLSNLSEPFELTLQREGRPARRLRFTVAGASDLLLAALSYAAGIEWPRGGSPME